MNKRSFIKSTSMTGIAAAIGMDALAALLAHTFASACEQAVKELCLVNGGHGHAVAAEPMSTNAPRRS